MIKRIRPYLSIVLVVLAIAIAVVYIATHHKLITDISHISVITGISVFVLYCLMLVVLMILLTAQLRICNYKLNTKENLELNANSLFINFFVPGQGGPAYRALYLLKKHRLKIKNYLMAVMFYYLMYAIVSIFFLLVTNRPWWQTLLATVFVACLGSAFVRRYSRKSKSNMSVLNLSSSNLMYLLLATVLQASLQAAIYGVELHSVSHHIHITQIITYTGAANLALFVSLTPGGIGVRETFLLFTRRLHHISSSTIIVANVIDRSVFVIFLLVLLLITLITKLGSKEKFFSKKELMRPKTDKKIGEA